LHRHGSRRGWRHAIAGYGPCHCAGLIVWCQEFGTRERFAAARMGERIATPRPARTARRAARGRPGVAACRGESMRAVRGLAFLAALAAINGALLTPYWLAPEGASTPWLAIELVALLGLFLVLPRGRATAALGVLAS